MNKNLRDLLKKLLPVIIVLILSFVILNKEGEITELRKKLDFFQPSLENSISLDKQFVVVNKNILTASDYADKTPKIILLYQGDEMVNPILYGENHLLFPNPYPAASILYICYVTDTGERVNLGSFSAQPKQ